MRIIFMGTPEFAVPSLEILIANGYNVVAVVTSTDKFGGRGGKKLLESAVKKCAMSHGIPILQPKNLKAPEFVEKLSNYKADLQIIVAFRMLPVVVWDMPPKGSVNLHASLLPAYRGAAPINWAIINGEKETGLTTFKLKHAIDTGNIIFQEKIDISSTDTAGSLHDKMMDIGAALVLKTVNAISTGTAPSQAQPEMAPTKAPKLFNHNCKIDWNKDVKAVYNFIRGLSPYPTAWTMFQDKKVNLYEVSYIKVVHNFEPGKWISDNKGYLRFSCKNGLIDVKKLQLAGRKKMDIKSFLNGYTIENE